MSERQIAEAARRRALAIELLPVTSEREAERRECVAIWNAFCAKETKRIEKAKRAPKFSQILPGIWVESR